MRYSRRFFLIVGILMAVSEIWKQWTLTFLIHHGHYILWNFPFQLCSTPMYLCLYLGVVNPQKHRSYILAYLMDFALLGGVFAFLDTSGMYYLYRPLSIHSFVWHFALILIGCYAGLCKETEHSARGLRFSISLYLVFCCIATIINLLLDPYGEINMFYINPHYPMRQKVIVQVAHSFGNPAGLFTYLICCMLGGCLLHLFWNLVAHRKFMNRI